MEASSRFTKLVDSLEQQKQFVQGLGLGLLLGIVGNMFVSHYYGFFEAWIEGTFDNLFFSNLILIVVALSAIIVLIIKWIKDINELEKKRKPLNEFVLNTVELLEYFRSKKQEEKR